MHCHISFMIMTSVHVHVIRAWSLSTNIYARDIQCIHMYGFGTKNTQFIYNPTAYVQCAAHLPRPLLLLVVQCRPQV